MKKIIDTSELNNTKLKDSITIGREIVQNRIKEEFKNVLSDREIFDIISSVLFEK